MFSLVLSLADEYAKTGELTFNRSVYTFSTMER